MKKLALFFFIILLAVIFQLNKTKPIVKPIGTAGNTTPSPLTSISPKARPKNISYSVFVPYWASLTDTKMSPPNIDVSLPFSQNGIIYFGITANEQGIDTTESGYNNLSSFVNNTNGQKILTLRLIQNEIVDTVLTQPDLQKKIIDDTIDITKKNGFDELLLDLEVRAIPTEKTVSEITTFISRASSQVKANNLRFSVALYGDVLYRKRPYDIAAIAKITDMIYVMAYDFHKSNGEPGSNFPLSGKDIYGYDLAQMIDDYLQFVDPEKLTVVFGMYGYDWTLDADGRPLKAAAALSLKSIRNNFITSCNKINCLVQRDKISSESTVRYVDENGYAHKLWFEDERSIEQKIKYLITKQIHNVSFWAYGYF